MESRSTSRIAESDSDSDQSTSDEDLCGEDLELNYLELEPDQEPDPDQQENHGQPEAEDQPQLRPIIGDEDGDPDDPAGDNSDESDSEEDSDDERETFSFDDAALNTPLQFGHQCTRREVLLLSLAAGIKNLWTYECQVDDLSNWIAAIGQPGITPTTRKQLWSLIKKQAAGTKYAYCGHCLKYHGNLKKLKRKLALEGEEDVVCTCGVTTPIAKMRWFLKVSLIKQLQHFLATPGIAWLLRYRFWRVKHNINAIEDIFDGEVYIHFVEDGTIGENDFTCVLNTDGFTLFKKNSVNVTAVYIRLNELPPNVRQRHLFLVAIWVDKVEPRMNTLLRPFIKEMNKVSTEGVLWKPDGINEVRSRVIPICLCVDAKARCKVMNQHQWNGQYGCFLCTNRGIQLEGSNKYPLLPYEDLPMAEDRTHQSISEAMLRNEFFEGQIGFSVIMDLEFYDMAKGNGMDDLHPFYEGVASFYLDLIIGRLGAQAEGVLRDINFRMSPVRTPIQMARKWSSINKRSSWKGSQWGYFIRYLSVLCFLGSVLPVVHKDNLAKLSYALFVTSRDSIAPDELDTAEGYLTSFLRYFQDNFGAEKMRFNVHMLQHAIGSRRNFGPAWTISTFNFESWNHKLGLCVTSPKGVAEQIVTRHFLKLYVHTAVHRDDVSAEVKAQMSHLLFSTPRKLSEEVGDGIHVLGRPSPRVVTEDEGQLLTRSGINARQVSDFERVIVRGIEYRTRSYHPHTRSDNSVAYTWDNKFVTIEKIFLVRDNNNAANICGMFVINHAFDHPIQFAHHIGHFTGNDQPSFLRAEVLRVPAIKITVQNAVYVVPMASCHEID